jgi:putative ABC transport system ATP-binding protein
MQTQPVVEVAALRKHYEVAHERLSILEDVSFAAQPGELVAVMGPSGSGKTTFISLLAGLDNDYSGSIRMGGVELKELSRKERVSLRSSRVGMIFQDFRLLPQLTAMENVEAPLYLQSMKRAERLSRAQDALTLVRLAERKQHRPDQLSGGERQRTAIARALVGGAQILLCDEPTGNLNREMSDAIFELLKSLCHDYGKTIILSTHDHAAERFADRVLVIENGKIRESGAESGSA